MHWNNQELLVQDIKSLFLFLESKYGGAAEGIVASYNDKIIKFQQSFQTDQLHRAKIKSAFTPQGTSGYSTAGQMAGALGTLGSLWGTYEATKAAKEANKLKREQYDYLKSRDAKSDAYKSNLGLAFASAYQGPKYTSTPTAPATAPVKL